MRQLFERLPRAAAPDVGDARFEHFQKHVWPRIKSGGNGASSDGAVAPSASLRCYLSASLCTLGSRDVQANLPCIASCSSFCCCTRWSPVDDEIVNSSLQLFLMSHVRFWNKDN